MLVPLSSSYGALILFIKKKDGSLHLCVDFQALNKVTKKDCYLLPLISDLLDTPRQAWIYSKDKVEFSDKDYIPYQHESYTPAPLPMPDMTEFDVPLPLDLQNTDEEDQEEDPKENTYDMTPQPLASPPSMIHVPDPLKLLDPAEPGPSFEGIHIIHLGHKLA